MKIKSSLCHSSDHNMMQTNESNENVFKLYSAYTYGRCFEINSSLIRQNAMELLSHSTFNFVGKFKQNDEIFLSFLVRNYIEFIWFEDDLLGKFSFFLKHCECYNGHGIFRVVISIGLILGRNKKLLNSITSIIACLETMIFIW